MKRTTPDQWNIGPVALLVAGLLFMDNLDASVLPTAAPTIARSFHILSAQVGICVTVYLVTVVVLGDHNLHWRLCALCSEYQPHGTYGHACSTRCRWSNDGTRWTVGSP
jgi:hypothetical protein